MSVSRNLMINNRYLSPIQIVAIASYQVLTENRKKSTQKEAESSSASFYYEFRYDHFKTVVYLQLS
ncbi:hypothetical protein [Bacillus sp. JCM 19034]|uniref:hypothetical protein n=1 Tax=Bacillus sp. JCM 19034 TaxID=1481928 RepID=UPI0012E186E9|nr:hypothetical protein [Bacillus sp. JCM 19034]